MSAAVSVSRVLYGREDECEAIAALLDGARSSQSGVLVLWGEAGIGKSALLADAVDRARGMQVIRAVGVESESELAFAALHQVVTPLLGYLAEIPPPQRAALEGALGLAQAAHQDRFLAAAAVLSLFAAAAEEEPLLCLVDDAHWLDKPSADALTFAARRLHAEPIALIFAAREGEVRTFEAVGLPELRLAGLEAEDACALLAERVGPVLSTEVRDRLVASTRGNPLALIELPEALSESQLAGREPLVDPLPLTARVENAFLERARRLPDPSQTLLLLAAADDTGDPEILVRGSKALKIDVRALDAAETAGLVSVKERVAFRHPLVRSAVYQGATFAHRQMVHRALVEALDGERYSDRRAWHRAAATLGTDACVADELEQSAEQAKRRSGYGAAAEALERAATLTPDDEQRARRLAAAGEAAWLGGLSERASALLDSAHRLTSEPLLRADIDHFRGLMELQRGMAPTAYEVLLAAAEEVAPLDPRKAAEMLHSAGEAAAIAGDIEGEIAAGRHAESLRGDRTSDQFEVPFLAGIANLLEGDVAKGASLLRAAIERVEASPGPRRWFGAGSAAAYLGDMPAACRFWGRAVAEAREEGAISLLAYALAMLAPGEMWDRSVASARANASEGLRLARETGLENCACYHLAVLARAAAFYCREEECRARAAEAFELATAHGLGLQAGMATWALGELELVLGRPAEALSHFETVCAGGRGVSHPGLRWLVAPDLVEAAVRLGRIERARAAVSDFEEWATKAGSPLSLPLLARCRALLSNSDAQPLFEEALRLHAESKRPFDQARTELLYGELLRRERKRREAREHLRTALASFDQLGAAGWAERARIELRASGETARKRDPSTVDELTPQELQIARFVAGGASNKEVAAQLFLSPRTIDYHLRNVFVKLEVSSRTQLSRFQL